MRDQYISGLCNTLKIFLNNNYNTNNNRNNNKNNIFCEVFLALNRKSKISKKANQICMSLSKFCCNFFKIAVKKFFYQSILTTTMF